MKLFVTGVCGRLGRAVVNLAQTMQIQIVGVDQGPWPSNMPMPQVLSFHQGSFDDQLLIDRLMPGCDGLINTAGMHGEYIATCNLDQFIQSNVTQVHWLCDQAHKHGLKAVALSSTMEVLIGRGGEASRMQIFDESSSPDCDSIYSTSKLMMEKESPNIAARTGLSIACLRFMAFGYKGETTDGTRYLNMLLHSEDAASAAIAAATSKGLKGEVFNIASYTPLTLADSPAARKNPAELLEHYYPGSIALLQKLNINVQPKTLLPASRIEKAEQMLHWKPRWTFESWLINQGWQPSSQGFDAQLSTRTSHE